MPEREIKNYSPNENEGLYYARQLLDNTRHSVFLTGKAGTGKSTFLRDYAEATGKKHIILAPTGIAAINARGITIHSFFQIPFGPVQPMDPRLSTSRIRAYKRDIMRKMELMIIDEVSMIRADIMDAMDHILRKVRRDPRPFGGVQLLLVGDLLQLEPVVKNEEWGMLQNWYSGPFFFNALVFRELDLINIELEKVYRQQDEGFVDLLNRVRNGWADYHDVEQINSRFSNDSKGGNKQYEVTLTTTRAKADQINAKALSSLPGDAMTFEGLLEDDFPLHSLPTDQFLKLKTGAQVMFVKNDIKEKDRRWVNGTIGIIDGFEGDAIIVKLEDDTRLSVKKDKWEHILYRYDKKENKIEEEVIGTYLQYPLKLAWAVTIHKSQGLTFDRLVIDLDRGAFAAGQLYVALSRCRSLEGISLSTKVKPSDVIVRDAVLDFYRKMNDMSQIMQALKS
jgi:ATP-dependent exoDNAse (exonuclease V) alpha subunit